MARHVVPLQYGVGAAHWALVAQLVKQPVPLHAYPLHDAVDCVPHAPAPLHEEGKDSIPFAHVSAAQRAVGYAHSVVDPLQLPWHVPEPAQATRVPCG